MRRKSIEEVRLLFRNNRAEPIFKEYISANTPLKFRCGCGEEDTISITSLKRSLKNLGSIKCKRCRCKKLSKDKNLKAKNVILNKFKEVEIICIIPGKHEENPPKIIFKCPMCGEESSIFYKKYIDILLCKKCSRDLISEKQRLAQNEVSNLFNKWGANLISKYDHTNQKLIFECSCGNIGSVMLTNLKYKQIIPLCKQCQLDKSYPKGRNHYNWNPDLTEKNRLAWGRNNEDRQWYRKIFEKFKYTCCITGKRNIALSAHHLFQYSKYPNLRLDLNNGICISREIHLEFHKKYSYIDASIEDFCEFFNEKTEEDFIEIYDKKNKRWKENEMKTFTLNEVREVVKKCGAEPLFDKYTNSYSDYLVRCSCGKEDEIKFSTLRRNLKKNPEYKYRCFKCRNLGSPKHSTESIKRDIIKYEAEPLFDEYENLRKRINYRCACGNIAFTTGEMLYMHIKKYASYRLMCQSCTCKGVRKNKVDKFFEDVIKPYFIKEGVKLLSKKYENNHTSLKFICSCGNEAKVTWGSLKNNGCLKCRDCQLKDRPRGENHPDWNPMLSEEDRKKTRYGRGRLEKIWESCVLILSSYTCIISGQKGGALSAHHLNAWARNPEERFQLNNGVCMVKKIHKEFHNKYGMKKGNNTLKQFQEYYKEKTGKKFIQKNIILDFIKETPYPSFLLNKKRKFEKEGKEYIPFFIPEVKLKQDIVLSMAKYKLKIIKEKIFARKLKVVKIEDFSKVKNFLNENHIQGSTISGLNLALVDGGNILSLMTFNRASKNKNNFTLQRFCSRVNTVVVGGASKLFNYFIKEFDPDKITTYGDIRFSNYIPKDSIYFRLGFKYTHTSKPNYWYTKDGVNLIFRRKFQRYKLDKVFNKEFDSSLSERDIMLSEGYQRLYDCGNHVFVYEK